MATLKYPKAKRFAILFATLLFAGIVLESVKRSDLGDAILGIGLVGLVASGLIALEKKDSRKTSTTQQKIPPKPEPAKQKFGRERPLPGAYRFDLSTVGHVSLQMNGKPSTFLEVYQELLNSKIRETDDFSRNRYLTDEGEILLDGEIAQWPLKATMRKIANLMRKSIDPFAVTWYYYGNDWSIDADESYDFFAVHRNQIISDSESFSSEEPLILTLNVDENPVWHSQEYFSQAVESYWYRKFYTETMTGQLMVLRPDEPILYHYSRPSVGGERDIAKELQLFTLCKIYRMLWVVAPLLVSVVFPSANVFMVVVAGLAALDLLRLAWLTSKIGVNA